MPKLAICSVPKGFKGHVETIQLNALSSWQAIPDVEIVLLGDDEGVADAAMSVGAVHRGDVARNPSGTPLLDDIFEKMLAATEAEAICYVNADIILPADFGSVVAALPLPEYLVVGRRQKLLIEERVDLRDADTARSIADKARKEGETDIVWAMDYFAFPRWIDWRLPPFALGRTMWDNWLVARARRLGVPVIDATNRVLAIHQEHDYGHLGLTKSGVWSSEEAAENRRLADLDRLFTVLDANYVLDGSGLHRAFGYQYLRQRSLNWPLRHNVGRSVYRKLLATTRRLRGIDGLQDDG